MRISKYFPHGILGLTAVMILLAAPPVTASGPLLLAQTAKPKKEQAPSPTPPPQEPGRSKSMEMPWPPKMEEMQKSRKIGVPPAPSAAGTKKIGGQTIRDKESTEKD